MLLTSLRGFLCALLSGVVFFGFAGCTVKPRIDFDLAENYDFSAARSYAVVDTTDENSLHVGPGLIEAMGSGLVTALNSKGLSMEPADKADLMAGVRLELVDRTEITSLGRVPSSSSASPYVPLGGRPSVGSAEPNEQELIATNYKRLLLVVDLVDRATDDLVWRGWAAKNMYKDITRTTTDKQRDEIRSMITAILENYPPSESPPD